MIHRQNYHDWIESLINDEPKISISIVNGRIISTQYTIVNPE
jgi:hypothetical protein|uniref:ORF41a n=1 Tax=Pinus koraiensis TaxID=88728 RepID=A4QMI1_PINKO|nr:ORF41a [Pinus koraiensis]ABP35303.1 ORF41a [Pinus koraiensis]